MFFLGEGFSYRNFLIDIITIFFFILWLWLFITVVADLFRRHDISGWAKAIWIIFMVLIPYLTVLVYILAQGRGIAERSALRSQQAVESLRHAVGYSAADEIEKLNRLKQAGSITDDEFTRLRSRVVQ
jgi:hypothetical protein